MNGDSLPAICLAELFIFRTLSSLLEELVALASDLFDEAFHLKSEEGSGDFVDGALTGSGERIHCLWSFRES